MENQTQKNNQHPINVSSEIGTLERVLIHSPDGGIGNVPTSKIHDWLYDDIIDLEKMQKEHTFFAKTLLLFLDPDKLFIDGKFSPDAVKYNPEKSDYFGNENIDESKVLDTQYCLAFIFSEKEVATRELISSISDIEGIHINRKRDIYKLYETAILEREMALAEKREFIIGESKFMELAKTLITGKLEFEYESGELRKLKTEEEAIFIFPPIANFIFTRDIGVSIKDHIFITKPRYSIRKREVILLRFLAENYFLADAPENIIEIAEDDGYFYIEDNLPLKEEKRVSFEGGDIMMISEDHILIGCSERTSPYAIHKFIHRVFSEQLAKIVSVIKISEKRSQMHIDTVLSHVKKDVWVMFGQLSERWQRSQKKKESYSFEFADEIREKSIENVEQEKPVSIKQFYCGGDYDKKKNYLIFSEKEIEIFIEKGEITKEYGETLQTYKKLSSEKFNYTKPEGLEDLLRQISVNDFGVADKETVRVAYSGGGVFPDDEREQWTDSCNLLVVREGIAIGYDRNRKTSKTFQEKLGFNVIHSKQMVEGLKGRSKEEVADFINDLKDTIILLPSNELSRARGGSHCMSMPLRRKNI
jgi:arginine deiminase